MDSPAPHSAPDPSPAGDPAWKRLFAGRSPREILAELVREDALGLRARCLERLRAQAILIETDQLHLRALAHVARHGPTYQGAPPFDVWLAERVRRAAGELIDEQAARARSGDALIPPHDELLLTLATELGLEPQVLLRGAASFNRATYETRSVFYGVVIAGQSLVSWAADNGATSQRARAALRRAFFTLGVRDGQQLDGLLQEEDDEH